jgi:hypothetical protein
MTMVRRAAVTHAVPGRLRIRIEEARGDIALLDSIARELVSFPGVTAVEASALTGSILIRHAVEAAAVLGFARDSQLFGAALGPASPETSPARATPLVLDAWTLAGVALLALAALQFGRGKVPQ